MKFISVTLFLSQTVLAQNSDSSFIQKATGRFAVVKESPQNCHYGPYTVRFHSRKNAVLGKACGAVLWMSTPSDPTGIFFCNVDSSFAKTTIGLNLIPEKNEEPDFYASSSGKISDSAVQMTFPAAGNNQALFADAETSSISRILAVTNAGIDVEESVTLSSGHIEVTKCQYKRILR